MSKIIDFEKERIARMGDDPDYWRFPNASLFCHQTNEDKTGVDVMPTSDGFAFLIGDFEGKGGLSMFIGTDDAERLARNILRCIYSPSDPAA